MSNNEKIAVFMGAKEELEGFFYGIAFPHGHDGAINLKYDTSFDWLIPVVEKIYGMDEYYKYKDIPHSIFAGYGIELGTRIEPVYEAVIEFINWYNKQVK